MPCPYWQCWPTTSTSSCTTYPCWLCITNFDLSHHLMKFLFIFISTGGFQDLLLWKTSQPKAQHGVWGWWGCPQQTLHRRKFPVSVGFPPSFPWWLTASRRCDMEYQALIPWERQMGSFLGINNNNNNIIWLRWWKTRTLPGAGNAHVDVVLKNSNVLSNGPQNKIIKYILPAEIHLEQCFPSLPSAPTTISTLWVWVLLCWLR